MSMLVFAAIGIFTVICVRAAQRLAAGQGRKPVPWMVAAAALGPLALIPLALMQKANA